MNVSDANRKWLLALVTLVALGVWGTFAFRLTGGLQEGGPPDRGGVAAPGRSDTSEAPAAPLALRFDGAPRDPFQRPAALKAQGRPARPEKTSAPPKPSRPRLTLEGVVSGVAIIQVAGGQEGEKGPRFARRGDDIPGGRRVAEVTPEWVVVRHAEGEAGGGSSDTLRLPQGPARASEDLRR